MSMKNNSKEKDMVIDLQDANILPLDITKRQVKYLINRVNKLKPNQKVIFKAKLKKGIDFSKVIGQLLVENIDQNIKIILEE